MRTNLRTTLSMLALCASFAFVSTASHAATILKLNLGGTGPDVGMSGAGVFGTTSDGDGATTGDQNTNVEFTGFLDGPFTDIPTSVASFTLSGVLRDGSAIVGGGSISQNFMGGLLKLYGPAPTNELLLESTVEESSLIGMIGPPGLGAFFSITLGTALDGTIKPHVVPNSIGLIMPLSNVNDGMGFVVSGGSELQPFNSDASANLTANPIPEPASALLLLLAASLSAVSIRRRRRA